MQTADSSCLAALARRNDKIKGKIEVKGSGQECPLHTSHCCFRIHPECRVRGFCYEVRARRLMNSKISVW